jgi:hypothetical protein
VCGGHYIYIYKTGYWIDNTQYSYTHLSLLQLQLTLTTESQLLLSLSRAQDLLRPNWLSLAIY